MDKGDRQRSNACRDQCTAARLAANLIGASDPIEKRGIRAGDSNESGKIELVTSSGHPDIGSNGGVPWSSTSRIGHLVHERLDTKV